HIGKWHLGPPSDKGPVAKDFRGGFDDLWQSSNVLESTSHPYEGDLYDGDGKPMHFENIYRTDYMTNLAQNFLRSSAAKSPFLLTLSYLEVHHQNDIDAFVPPKEYQGKYKNFWVPQDLRPLPGSWPSQLGDYYGSVAKMDETVGTIRKTLKETGLDKNTIVMFVSDHGCHFKTRNTEYKRSPHESSIHVPLIFEGPGFNRGAKIPEMVSHVDIAPSLLSTLGLNVPSSMQGRNFLPLLDRKTDGWVDEAYFEMSEFITGRGLRTPQYTYAVATPKAPGWRNGYSRPPGRAPRWSRANSRIPEAIEMFPILSEPASALAAVSGPVPHIRSLLIKPASAICNLDCEYCFYLDRETDPYTGLAKRTMSLATLEKLIEGYLFYSAPESAFAFQGGEPTLAGLPFFQKLVEFQQRHGRGGQRVSNSIQTNGILIDRDWCDLFRDYSFLVGLSLDGPEELHDRYRFNKAGHGTAAKVVDTLHMLQNRQIEYSVLCVVSQANVAHAAEVFAFFRKLGVGYVQFIPCAEFQPDGTPMPFTISADEYGKFLCEIFDLWWPERRQMGVRFFDNIAEALAGRRPGTCTMHESCDSYAVVEYNGDVFPCDFFVEKSWKLGNVMT